MPKQTVMSHQTESITIYSEKPNNFIPQVEVAAAYLQIDNKTLFLQRSGSEKGCWGVPAGKIEKNESPIEAVVRELSEETGIYLPQEVNVREAGKLYMVKPHVSYVYHMFVIKLSVEPSVTLSPEHLDFGWFFPDEIEKIPLMSGALEAYKACSY